MSENKKGVEIIRNPHTGSIAGRPQPDRARPAPPPANPKPNESKK